MKELNITGDVNWFANGKITINPRSIIKVFEIDGTEAKLVKTYNRKYVGDKQGKKDIEQIATLWVKRGYEINKIEGFGFA